MQFLLDAFKDNRLFDYEKGVEWLDHQDHREIIFRKLQVPKNAF